MAFLTLGGINMNVPVRDERSPNGDQNKQKPNSPANSEAKPAKKPTVKKAEPKAKKVSAKKAALKKTAVKKSAVKKAEPKAKKEKQAKSPAPPPEPTPAVIKTDKPTEPPKPISLKERLLAQKGQIDTVALSQKLAEKREVCETPELMKEFADLIGKADEIGVEHLSLDRPRHTAEREWFNQSLQELVRHLQKLSSMDEDVGKLYGALQDYLQNAFIGETFWRVIQEIVRPFANVTSNGELQKQLRQLVNYELVEFNPDRYDQDSVLVFIGPTKFVYAPKRERTASGQWEPIPIVKVGWQFVKAAATRAREGSSQRWRELKALRDKATINAKEALDGKDGIFYIQPGTAVGFLVKQKDDKLSVLEAIGLRAGKLPSRPVSWDAPSKEWPSHEIHFAFHQWKARVEKKLATN